MPDIYGSGNVVKARTLDATPITVAEIALPNLSIGSLQVTVLARTAAGVRGSWSILNTGGREAAAVTAIGAPLVSVSRLDVGAATWAASLVVTANGIAVQLTGALATTIDWMVITHEIVFTP